MEPVHYDRIADKIVQFRSKIPLTADLNDPVAIAMATRMRTKLDLLLKDIDDFAWYDERGWIR